MLIHEPAFDPIFWLHHCNADRLLSLWSALHPNVGVSADRQDNGSFTISQNAKIHEDTRKHVGFGFNLTFNYNSLSFDSILEWANDFLEFNSSGGYD